MEIIGIICEYNPLHNGHIYHLKEIKKLYPESIIILVLNSYFQERGEISIQTKESKTKLALDYGCDIVLELPSIYGTQSADTFADISIKILNNFHVNKIIFGSESNDIKTLINLAKKELAPEFNKSVQINLKQGINYPTALAKSLNTDFIFNPNDLLGISYIKAILKNNYNITPVTIKRTNNYHDTLSNEEIISASNIREKIKNNENIDKYLPKQSQESIIKPNEEMLFCLLKAKILTSNDLEKYLDVDEGIENRLKEKIIISNNYSELIENIKTKRYTHNKIKRMLTHILLGITKKDALYKLDYIKILGFNQKGKQYINKIKDNLIIPTTVNKNSLIYQNEIKTSLIYDLINHTNTYQFEKSTKPIIKL